MALPKPEAPVEAPEVEWPDVESLVTEDDEPVDNIASEKQQRLLVDPLYSSGAVEPPFLAAANVGVFSAVKRPPVVPDMFLSTDVRVADNWWEKAHRSYFLWEFGKPPDVVVEIVSNKEGGETDRKMLEYQRMRVLYYVVYDPQHLLLEEELRIFELHAGGYAVKGDQWLDGVGLGLTLWEGIFEGKQDRWLRWCGRDGEVILTGAERADREHERAERLAARLKAAGIDPDEP